jgi:hypothetical protein
MSRTAETNCSLCGEFLRRLASSIAQPSRVWLNPHLMPVQHRCINVLRRSVTEALVSREGNMARGPGPAIRLLPAFRPTGGGTWSTLTASIALAEMSTPLRARAPRSKRTCTARTARGQRRALYVWSSVRRSALAGASRYQMRLASRLRRGSCVEKTARRRVQNLGAVLALSQERRKLHETRCSATLRPTDTQHTRDYTRDLRLVAGTDPGRSQSPPATIPAGRAPCTEARTGAD